MQRRQVSDLDLLFQFINTFRDTKDLLKAAASVGELARRKNRPIRIVAPPILHFVAEHFGITTEQIVSRSRHRTIVEARRVSIWLLRDGGLSLPKVGASLGVHHSSVFVALQKIEKDPALMAVALKIQARIEQAVAGVAEMALAPGTKTAA